MIDNFAEFLLVAVASIFKDPGLSPMVSFTQFIVVMALPMMVVFTGFTAHFASLFVPRITNKSLRHALPLNLVWVIWRYQQRKGKDHRITWRIMFLPIVLPTRLIRGITRRYKNSTVIVR